MVRICWGRSAGCFIYNFVIKWSVKKTLCSKAFTSSLRDIFHENNRNYNWYRFSDKFVFILFLSFLTNQKQESGF